LLEAHKLTQIRTSTNSCVLSESELAQKFPWIEPKCVNIFEVSKF